MESVVLKPGFLWYCPTCQSLNPLIPPKASKEVQELTKQTLNKSAQIFTVPDEVLCKSCTGIFKVDPSTLFNG